MDNNSDIVLDSVSYSYPNEEKNVLSDVSFQIEKGKFTVIMGRTGAGKTTTLMCMNGIIPQLMEGNLSGSVSVSNMNVAKYRVQTMVKHIGLVMQDSETQVFGKTVEEDVAFGPRNYMIPRDKILQMVDDALKRVRLSGYEKRETSQLSGGERQRLAIAGILAMNPSIIALDEPTSELDPIGREEIYQTITDLRNEKDKTIVAVEHSSQEISQKADHLIIINDGHVTWSGIPSEFFRDLNLVEQNSIKPIPVSIFGWEFYKHGMIEKQQVPLTVPEAFSLAKNILDGKKILEPTPAEKPAPVQAPKEPVLVVDHLTYRYSNDHVALNDISLKINRGDFVAIIGQNGAGKTTLAKHFNGILTPTSGNVFVCGQKVQEKNSYELTQYIGYVFQNPDHQIFCTTVFNELAYGLQNLGLKEEEIKKRVDDVLELTNLSEYRDVHPFSLGKGQRQMIAVASIIVMHPSVLVVDEPTTGLDWLGINRMMDLICKLHQSGTTIVMITHDMDIVARYATRAVVMKKGNIVLDGATREVFSKPDVLRDAYVSPPQCVELSAKLNSLGLDGVVLDMRQLADMVINSCKKERKS
mgnify:CR=1 FL=1